jgi:sulfate-transporting ATPase
MREILLFVFLGLSVGALYAIAAQGLVLIYRASGVLNLAQAGFATLGAYAYYELTLDGRLPLGAALVLATLIGSIAGIVFYLLVLRPMRESSPLAKVVATLGVLVVAQAAAVLIYSHDVRAVHSILPTRSVSIWDINLGFDRVLLFFIGLALTVVLWAIYRYTKFGRVTSAVAENELATASLGHSPDLIAAANWAIGCGLAALAGSLFAPITFLEPNQLGLLILPAIAAALLGGFSSFPLAFAAACAIGVAESLSTRYIGQTGLRESVPFLAVIIFLVATGRGLPLRSHIADRLPKVGTGRLRPLRIVILTVVAGALIFAVVPSNWAPFVAVTLAWAVLCLSVVVVSGYAGQLSLAQFVLGGTGAFAAAKLMNTQDIPFVLAFPAAIAVATVVGGIVGIPALRTRGINLAIATLGLAVTIFALLLNNVDYTGGVYGVVVNPPTLFGWSIDPRSHPDRYALFAFVTLVIVFIAVANVRRGAVGRRLLAVRSDERAVAVLGVSVYATKMYAFMLAAAIAGIGGTLLAFLQTAIIFNRFEVFASINLVTATVVGGVGFVGGALFGATLLPGGITARLMNEVGISEWLPLIGGVFVLLIVRLGGDGLFEMHRQAFHQIGQKLRGLVRPRTPSPVEADEGEEPTAEAAQITVSPLRLSIDSLTVRFGGVTAVDDFSMTLTPGRVHGLIGPNGAGKTTVIDAITGFVDYECDLLEIGAADIKSASPRKRAQAGIGRSFQSAELFSDMTVRENVAVGCDDRARRRYITDLVRPGKPELSAAAEAALREFELTDSLDVLPTSLPFGRRRLVAIARAIASAPSVLLLDEPAAGLDHEESAELAGLIGSLAHEWGIAVLLVEHNVDLVLSVCDEITVLDQGATLVVAASPAEVREHPAVLEAYLGKDDEPTPAGSVSEGPSDG